ncbi:hypothetical protein [Lysobacter capsici]|uniref:hypothetical protein n=1 Tax=Lysobacter capsici TaxID=435897 RepID=UPI001C00841C|nr:hypothetical protein [Lysobacter capsici]QWF16561.1 hypothetical protein KME82_22880 [Lysobacter capsici]
MKTAEAYALLLKELETVRNLPEPDLVALVGRAASGRVVDVGGEPIEIEWQVAWQDRTHAAVRVTAHARGPSTWRHEHLQETITIAVSSDAAAATRPA